MIGKAFTLRLILVCLFTLLTMICSQWTSKISTWCLLGFNCEMHPRGHVWSAWALIVGGCLKRVVSSGGRSRSLSVCLWRCNCYCLLSGPVNNEIFSTSCYGIGGALYFPQNDGQYSPETIYPNKLPLLRKVTIQSWKWLVSTYIQTLINICQLPKQGSGKTQYRWSSSATNYSKLNMWGL